MIKINYPKDKDKFEKDYQKIFNISKDSWYKVFKDIDCCTRRVFTIYKIESLDDLLVAPFNVLLEIYKIFPKEENKKLIYEKLFNYEGLQPKIADFFMEYSKELNLKTCYFCNIDFINTINFEILDILQDANEQELKELDGIGEKKAKDIIEFRKQNKINTINDIENIGGIKDSTKVKKSIIKKNHFTLDHFLPKAECPLLALSLYNFVPSCYSCNSKFKKEKKLLETYLSPTSEDFAVGKEIKFKIYYKDKIAKTDLILKMEYPNKIKNYVSTFKLKGRYKFHQNEALTLIDKQEKYSETRIEEIANILKISSHQVKKDIFGEELFSGDIQDKSFTKMKRDVANNIGIKGVEDDK